MLEIRTSLAFGLLFRSCDAGVVNQDAETFLARFYLRDETANVVFGGDVARERYDLASDVLAVDGSDGLKLLFSAADYVDLGAVDGKCLDGINLTSLRILTLPMVYLNGHETNAASWLSVR